jgi:hypothetical protein
MSKMLSKMETETAALLDAQAEDPSGANNRKYLAKMQTLADTFEARARQTGIAKGRVSFELQANLLFDRMSREPS